MYEEYKQEASILLKNMINIPSFSKEEKKGSRYVGALC